MNDIVCVEGRHLIERRDQCNAIVYVVSSEFPMLLQHILTLSWTWPSTQEFVRRHLQYHAITLAPI
jgi:hypothetical protein